MGLEIGIFRFFNNFAGLNDFWDSVFSFIATNTLWVMWLIFIVFLIATYDAVVDPLVTSKIKKIVGKRLVTNLQELRVLDYRLALVAFVSSGVSFVVNQVIGIFWFRERPFVVLENVHKLIEKSALDKAFPSDHTALAFALAFTVFTVDRRWGTLFIVLAVIQGLGRVVSGVHYLSDIIGGMIVAGPVVWLAVSIVKLLSSSSRNNN